MAFWSQYLVTLPKYLVPWSKYLGPSLPKIHYLTLSDHILPKNIEHIWFTCLLLTYLLNIGHIFALCIQYLVQWPKYLGPYLPNIQYLTSPDQKLSKNIYFIGSEWYISLSVLGQSCSVSHLQQPNLGQNYLTKIGARPDKTSNKLLLGSKVFA